MAVAPDGPAPSAVRGVSADELRRHNLSSILGHLHANGPASRSELTSMTGLNRSTVADLVDELGAVGVVEEDRSTRASGPGRPSPTVSVKPHGAVVLAVELAVDSLAVATVGLGGHIFNQLRIDRPRERFSPEETVEDVAKLAQPLLVSLPEPHGFAGVGVAVVGVTRRSDGFVHLAPNLGWRDVPLGSMLADSLSVDSPVTVANEADLGALGEHRRGAGSGVANMVFISGEVGVGAGVILGGVPLHGAAGYAGEAGHTLINPAGLRCSCGAFGCWETEAGEGALLRQVGEPAQGGRAAVDRLLSRAAGGDEKTLAAIASIGRWLGLGIGDLINIFNPELVVLGGLFNRLYPFIDQAMRDGVASRALDAPGRMATIGPAGLGAEAPVVGAAEMALSRVLADPSGASGGQIVGLTERRTKRSS
jgi:predicted NBD/HSP70 family sugar kinase